MAGAHHPGGKGLDPETRTARVVVMVDEPYRSAVDAICRRIYEACRGGDYLDELVCVAQDNLARAAATMAPGGDAIRFMSDIDTEVNALTDLPRRAERPVVRELHRSDLVAAVAVSGDMSIRNLEIYALSLEDRLLTLPEWRASRSGGFPSASGRWRCRATCSAIMASRRARSG